MAYDATSPFGIPWGVVALLVAAATVVAAVAFAVIGRRDLTASRRVLVVGLAFVATLWTTFTIAGPVTSVPFDPNGVECLLDPFGEATTLAVRWDTECGQAMALHLFLSIGPSLLVLIGTLIAFSLRLTRDRPRAVRWACAAVVPALAAASVTVATVRQANDLEHECENWSSIAAALVEGDNAAGQLPVDLAARQRAWAEGSDDRRAQLERVWVGRVVNDRVRELDDAIEQVVDDPDYRAYSDNRMVVTKCEYAGLTVEGAEVNFTGHMEYLLAAEGQWSRSPLTRYSVHLVDAGDDAWLLGDISEDQLESP